MEQLWDPRAWAEPEGYVLLWLVIAITILGVISKLAGAQWDDWLDERVGRGSIRDDWPFDRSSPVTPSGDRSRAARRSRPRRGRRRSPT